MKRTLTTALIVAILVFPQGLLAKEKKFWDMAVIDLPSGLEIRPTLHRDTGQKAVMISKVGGRLYDPKAYAGVVKSYPKDNKLSMRAYVRGAKAFYRRINAVPRPGSERWNASKTVWSAEYSIPERKIARELIRIVQTEKGFVEAFAGVRSVATWRSPAFRKFLSAAKSVRAAP